MVLYTLYSVAVPTSRVISTALSFTYFAYILA